MGNIRKDRAKQREAAVHPHTRGEHPDTLKATAIKAGSSPHPWGTFGLQVVDVVKLRFIPTPVGNIGGWRRQAGPSAVHPHTREEHPTVLLSPATPNGSSPHPWGTSAPPNLSPVRQRFIPTPVGNISALARTLRLISVHPHTRGEHLSVMARAMRSGGSSPHPWGTSVDSDLLDFIFRFIPTPVGNI